MSKSLIELAGSITSDALALFGVPTATLQHALGQHVAGRIEIARDTLLDEVRRGKVDMLVAASQDDAIGVIYRYCLAPRDNAARLNLRLLAKVIVGQAKRDRLYAAEFNRYANTLATMTRDEVVVIAALHRHTKVYEMEIESGDENAPAPFMLLSEKMVPDQFPTEAHLESVCAGAMRTGMLLMGRKYKTAGTYLTSPLVDEILELASFEDALQDER